MSKKYKKRKAELLAAERYLKLARRCWRRRKLARAPSDNGLNIYQQRLLLRANRLAAVRAARLERNRVYNLYELERLQLAIREREEQRRNWIRQNVDSDGYVVGAYRVGAYHV